MTPMLSVANIGLLALGVFSVVFAVGFAITLVIKISQYLDVYGGRRQFFDIDDEDEF